MLQYRQVTKSVYNYTNLELGGFACNLFLVISHGIKSLDDDLLGLLILHVERLD